jgi:hypothetical protein
MSSRAFIPLLALALGCSAGPPMSRVVLTPQTRFGLGEEYGPGIVMATAREMRFELAVPAHAIVLRVTQEGVEPVRTTRDTDPAIGRGTHSVTAVGKTARRPLPTGAADVPAGPGLLECVPILDPNLQAKPSPGCVSRAVAGASPAMPSAVPSRRQSGNERGYWLLIVSDTRTPAAELEHRLAELEFDDTPLLTTVLELPSALVGGRTTNWTAYFVGFAESTTAHSR